MKKQLMIMLSMLFLFCVPFLSGCDKKSDNSVLRIAHFPNITHAQALVGRDNGSFQNAIGDACTVEFKTFNAGPSEIEAFMAGEVDLGYIGPGPAINGFVKSEGDLIILSGATDAGAIFVSRKDLVISDFNELEGKKIAVPQLGNTQHLSLLNLLEENGMSDTSKGGTVEIVAAENPDIKTLLEQGQIDAAFVPEPWGSRLILEAGANIILDYNEVFRDGQYTTAVVIGRKDFIQENPGIVSAFLKAHVELTDYINNHPGDAKVIINRQINDLTQKPLDAQVLDLAFSKMILTVDPEKASLDDFASFSLNAGFLEEKPDLSQALYLDPLNGVLTEKGMDIIE